MAVEEIMSLAPGSCIKAGTQIYFKGELKFTFWNDFIVEGEQGLPLTILKAENDFLKARLKALTNLR